MTGSRPHIAWEDSHGRLWQGDVRACLAAMEPESVQCVVTSPPFWGLRAYGTAPQIWGGSPKCDHMLPDAEAPSVPRLRNGQGASTLNSTGGKLNAGWDAWLESQAKPPMTGGSGTASAKQISNAGSQFGNAWAEETRAHPMDRGSADGYGPKQLTNNGTVVLNPLTSATCTRCGAWRGELGSEPLHDCVGWATGVKCGACFICHLVEVFIAVKRVLRPDGVCLVNLGDSMAAGKSGRDDNSPADRARLDGFGHGGGVKLQTAGNTGKSRRPPPASDLMELRDDLTPEERAYVLAELAKCSSL